MTLPDPAAAPSIDADAPEFVAELVADDLVEEVSIDGMCGVY
jgi:mycofactocin precursor